MTRESGPKAAPKILPRRTTKGEFTSNADLERRRARRVSNKLMAELRRLLESYDAGTIGFSEFACSADLLTAAMADIALSGKLVAA